MLRITNLLGFAKHPTGNINDEMFTDGAMARAWTVESFQTHDAAVPVVEAGGVLTISPLTSTAGSHYNGYKSTSSYNCTNKTVTTELVQRANNDTRFTIGIDVSNNCQFIIGAVNITFRVRTSGVNSDGAEVYNATDHRWLRFRHASGNLMFESSADGDSWVTERTVATPSFGITSLRVGMEAGTSSSSASPGQAIFDNFRSDL